MKFTRFDDQMARKNWGGRPRNPDRSSMLTQRVNCAVSGNQKAAIEAAAKSIGLNPSALIRKWIDAGCPMAEKGNS